MPTALRSSPIARPSTTIANVNNNRSSVIDLDNDNDDNIHIHTRNRNIIDNRNSNNSHHPSTPTFIASQTPTHVDNRHSPPIPILFPTFIRMPIPSLHQTLTHDKMTIIVHNIPPTAATAPAPPPSKATTASLTSVSPASKTSLRIQTATTSGLSSCHMTRLALSVNLIPNYSTLLVTHNHSLAPFAAPLTLFIVTPSRLLPLQKCAKIARKALDVLLSLLLGNMGDSTGSLFK